MTNLDDYMCNFCAQWLKANVSPDPENEMLLADLAWPIPGGTYPEDALAALQLLEWPYSIRYHRHLRRITGVRLKCA